MITAHKDEATGKYTIFLNASAYKITACPRRAFFILLAGLKEKGGTSYKMEFGTAFHKFVRLLYMNADPTVAVKTAIDHYMPSAEFADWRSMEYLVQLCKDYIEYEKNTKFFTPELIDGMPALEQRFALPFYSSSIADYVLCGTIDMIATHPLYGKVIVDHKTTSVRTKDSYLASYEFSPQLAIYTLIATKLNLGVRAAVINGIFMSKGKPAEFLASGDITFTNRQLAELEARLKKFVLTLDGTLTEYLSREADSLALALFPRDFTQCEGKWGMCPFTPLCRNDSYETVSALARDIFKAEPYNPLKFQEVEGE
jgi:hypothetical protein